MSDWSIKQRLREEFLEAVERSDMLKVEELLDKGANVNESEGGYLSKKTVLLLAIENCNVDVAKLLVDRGADLTVTVTVTGKKKTVIDMARDKELDTLADYIQKKQDLNERLLASVKDGKLLLVQEAITQGANVGIINTTTDINQPDCTLLQLALIRGHTEVAKVLMQNGVDLHYVMKWEDGSEDTARSYADRMNYGEIVSLLDEQLANEPGKTSQLSNANNNTKISNTNGSAKNVEVYDIEDVDELPEETVGQKTRETPNNKSKGCTVS